MTDRDHSLLLSPCVSSFLADSSSYSAESVLIYSPSGSHWQLEYRHEVRYSSWIGEINVEDSASFPFLPTTLAEQLNLWPAK